MFITSARIAGDELILKSSDLGEIRRFAYLFREGNYEIKRQRKKRSNDANAYFFVLVDKLSAKLGIPTTEIYRNYIREIGGVSEVVCVKNEAVERLCKEWCRKGIGWQTDTMPSKIKGCTNVVLYYGSSTYDRAQFSRLLDLAIQDCNTLDIEVRTPDEIANMLSLWESEKEKK